MRIYFNTSALSRPFDDLASARTRLEAEAVAALLESVENETLEWIGSDYLDFEVTQDPGRERVGRLQSLMALVKRLVTTDDRMIRRAHRADIDPSLRVVTPPEAHVVRNEEGPVRRERLTNTEIRSRGWDALIEKLGPSGALRFAMQTERGQGDCSARRHRILGGLSVDELRHECDSVGREQGHVRHRS